MPRRPAPIVTLLWNMHRSGAACSLSVTIIGICLSRQHLRIYRNRPNFPAEIERTVDWTGMQDYSDLDLWNACRPTSQGFFPGDFMNLPNSLTTLRIFFVPLLVVVLLTRQPNFDFWGLPVHFEVLGVLILLVAAATDVMDGYLARSRKEITTLGILLDPIADKLLISAAFISLVEMGLMQAWMVVIIIGREFMVMGLREIASVEGLIIPASPLGKVKMILQVLAGCTVILTANHPALKLVGTVLLWLVVISAVASAGHYFQMFWTQINFRVQQRRMGALLVKPEEKPQDVLTR
jgi:CDP-diacylglycerol---glycerol-3-phosphate 3-phosphatidyltransferase